MSHLRFRFLGLIDSGYSGRGAARAEDAQGTPTQSHTSPSILVYEDQHFISRVQRFDLLGSGGFASVQEYLSMGPGCRIPASRSDECLRDGA